MVAPCDVEAPALVDPYELYPSRHRQHSNLQSHWRGQWDPLLANMVNMRYNNTS